MGFLDINPNFKNQQKSTKINSIRYIDFNLTKEFADTL